MAQNSVEEGTAKTQSQFLALIETTILCSSQWLSSPKMTPNWVNQTANRAAA